MKTATKLQPTHWVDEHADALYRFAMLHVGDADCAEELVQETFLSGLKAGKRFRGTSTERTWLIGILRHKICDHYRRRAREGGGVNPRSGERFAAAAFTKAGKWIRPPAAWTGMSDAPLDLEEFRGVLRECLERLPAASGDAFRLREILGLDTSETCQVLDLTDTNVWTLCHRARLLLRACLERNWFGKA